MSPNLHERTYLSGPMTGYPSYNYAAFERAASDLRFMSWNIVSPHEIPAPSIPLEEDALWKYYMKECKKQMEGCDSIILMAGWPESRGANQELMWALEDDMTVYFYHEVRMEVVRMSRP